MNAPLRPQVKSQAIPMTGGLDLVTPAIALKPSSVIAVSNFEATANGYKRYRGHERYDGHTKPSEAIYAVLRFITGTAAVTIGDTLTGTTSGAFATVLVTAVVESGSYGTSDAAGYIVITEINGDFVTSENLQVSGVTKCVSSGTATAGGALNDTDNTTWTRAAIEAARTAIQVVPGGGRITGVQVFDGDLYAFREDDATLPTLARMYKATLNGWALQALGYQLAFTSGGTYEILPGDTIIGNTSGANAVVDRSVLTSGLWSTGDAAGYFYLRTQIGTFQAETLTVTTHPDVGTISANSTPNSFLPGGSFEFVNYNFYGNTGSECMYGCDGVNRAFEWNGVTLAFAITATTDDKSEHIAAHKNHLFLSFADGILRASQDGDPLLYNGALGAAEFGIGADITGLLSERADTLAIFCRNKISILYGTDVNDWQLAPLTTDAGAIAGTMQMMGTPVFFDDRGARDMATTQAFGDFTVGHLTYAIDPLLEAKRRAGVYPTASMRVRRQDTYRVFYDDGTAISIYLSARYGAMTGMMTVAQPMVLDLGMVVRCCCSGEDDHRREILFFGSDDGYVYQMDAGTSFDGAALSAFIRLAFNASGAANLNKRYQKITLETDANPSATLTVTAQFSYGDPDQPAVLAQDFTVTGGGGFWDEALWDEFYWDNAVKGRAEARIDGFGFNISPTIYTSTIYEEPFTIHGMILNYSERGPLR